MSEGIEYEYEEEILAVGDGFLGDYARHLWMLLYMHHGGWLDPRQTTLFGDWLVKEADIKPGSRDQLIEDLQMAIALAVDLLKYASGAGDFGNMLKHYAEDWRGKEPLPPAPDWQEQSRRADGWVTSQLFGGDK